MSATASAANQALKGTQNYPALAKALKCNINIVYKIPEMSETMSNMGTRD